MPDHTKQLEAILFAASAPVGLTELAQLLDLGAPETTKQLQNLAGLLAGRGIRLLIHNDTYTLVSAPEAADIVACFLKDQAKTDLTKPALETLAIITYEQPITSAQLERLRGINSDQSLKGLLARGLITGGGTDSDSGQVQYITSPRLLTHLGLSSAEELPPLPEAADAA